MNRQMPGVEGEPIVAEPLPMGDAIDVESVDTVFAKIHRVLRGRYGIAIPLSLICAVGLGIAGYTSQQPLYQSKGQIQINPMLDVILYKTEQSSIMPMFNNFVKTQAKFLQSPRVIDRAMQSEGWQSLGRPLTPDSRNDFEHALEVKTDSKEGEWIRVSFLDPDPKAAQIAVKEVIRAYGEIHGDRWFDDPKKIETLEDRRRSIEAEIANKKGLIQQIAQEYGTADLSGLHDYAVSELQQLNAQVRQLALQIDAATATKATDSSDQPDEQQAEQSIDAIALVDAQMKQLLDQRMVIEGELERLKLSKLTEQHRDVKRARVALGTIEFQIKQYAERWRQQQQTAGAQNGLASTITPGASLEQLQAQYDTFSTRLTESRQRALELGRKRQRVDDLNAEINTLQTRLEEVTDRLDQIRLEKKVVDFGGVSGRINIVSFGTLPYLPAVDKRTTYAAVGGVMGFGIPLMLVFLYGRLDQRFRYSDEAGGAGGHHGHVTLLGILPSLPEDMSDPEQAAVAAHCVHQIRTLLQISGTHTDRRVVTVTSPTAGDGKTSLVLSLGLSFASSGARTLLIDFDMVGGGLSSCFNMRDQHNLAEVLEGAAFKSKILETKFYRLSILPTGRGDAELVSTLSPSVVQNIIESARDEYDMVLIDTGPILGSLEASLTAAEADGVVLTIGRGQQRGAADKAYQHLASVGAHLLGVVFNRAGSTDFKRSVSSASVRSIPAEGERAIVLVGAESEDMAKFGPMARTIARSDPQAKAS